MSTTMGESDLQFRIVELEAEIESVKSEASHLRTRFQSAVSDAEMANASVQGLERTVRLLRKNQQTGSSIANAEELQDVKRELEAAR